MKIGYDAKRLFGNSSGLGNYSRTLVSQLSASYPEHEFHLYSPKKGKIPFEKSGNTFEHRPDRITIGSLWRQYWIVNQLKRDGIQLFHGLSNQIPFAFNGSGIKTVVTVHDLIFNRFPEFYSWIDVKIHDKKAKYACLNADKVIAISEQTKKDIVHYYQIPEEKIHVVYQGCSSLYKIECQQTQKEELINRLKLPKEFVLNVGTIEERKNAILLVRAVAEIPNLHLVLVGSIRKEYGKKLLDEIRKLNVVNRVHVLSGLTNVDLAVLYQQAKIFVYPSMYEGFGIPIIEVLYSGTPVIAAKGSCLEEAGGPSSLYCDSSSVNEFKQAIEALFSNQERREEMVQIGKKFVRKFDDHKIANEVMKVYLSTFEA